MSGIHCPKCGQAATYLNGVVVCPRCDTSQRDASPPLSPPPLSPGHTTGEFDPYHRWLGIPKSDRPANHYRLLGIPLFESNSDVIESAADRQMAHVRLSANGPRSDFAQQILNEIATARVCLLNSVSKVNYDQQLAALSSPSSRPEASTSHAGGNAATPLTSYTPRKKRVAAAAPSPVPRIMIIVIGGMAGLAIASYLLHQIREQEGRRAREAVQRPQPIAPLLQRPVIPQNQHAEQRLTPAEPRSRTASPSPLPKKVEQPLTPAMPTVEERATLSKVIYDQQLEYTFPMYLVAFFTKDTFEPIVVDSLDKSQTAVPFFTEQRQAEQFRDAQWPDATIEPIATPEELRAYAEKCQQYEVRFVTIDPGTKPGARIVWISIDDVEMTIIEKPRLSNAAPRKMEGIASPSGDARVASDTGKQSDTSALKSQLNDPDPKVRLAALRDVASEQMEWKLLAEVGKLLDDVSPDVRLAAIKAIGLAANDSKRLIRESVVPYISDLTSIFREAENDQVRREVVIAISLIDPRCNELQKIIETALIGRDINSNQ